MKKKMIPRGKAVKGKNYADADEKYDQKAAVKEIKGKKPAGISGLLKKAEKEKGYSKQPRVKPQKKR